MPAVPASRWLLAMADGTGHGVVPGMLTGDDAGVVAASLASGRLRSRDVHEAGQEAVTAACGIPWWEAQKLVNTCATGRGETYVAVVMAGVDPDRVSIAAWCAAVYWVIVRNLDTKDRLKIDTDLMMPPGGNVDDLDGFDAVTM